MSASVTVSDQVIARIDAIIRELAALRQQLAAPTSAQEHDPQEPLIVEQDGQPGWAILSAEAYRRFRLWERREKARAEILGAMAKRRAQPAWREAFDLLEEVSQRANLSDEELHALIDKAVSNTP